MIYKPRVIQIIDSLNTGGAEVLAVNIANLLSLKGIDSYLCATREEGKLIANVNKNVNYIFLRKKRALDIKAIFKLKKIIKKNKINIVHAHSSSFFIAFCIKLVLTDVKIIWHDHFGATQELEERNLFPLKQISFFFKRIIAVNDQLKKWSLDNLYCKRVYILNNFAIFNNFENQTTLKGENDKRIIHLAAFREQKDHENLINAFHLFQNDFKDWTLHLIGFSNNDYSKKIIELIKNKDLEKHIFVYKPCLDIFNVLKQASIGVLSSNSEGLPLALLEYGLAKLPVVTTNVGDCNKVVLDNKTGFVVPSKNKNRLAYKLKQIASSKKLQITLGQNLHNHVQENFSSEKFIQELVKIYNK